MKKHKKPKDPIAIACKGPGGQFNLQAFNTAWAKRNGRVSDPLATVEKERKMRQRSQ